MSSVQNEAKVDEPTPDQEAECYDTEKKGFRFNAKSLGLTYSQCDIAPEKLVENIERLHPIKEYVAAQELHKDGAKHAHIYIVFQNKINTVNPRLFDYDEFHPNWLKPGKKWKAYVMKGGAFIHNMYRSYDVKNYVKTKSDWLEWEYDVMMNSRKEPDWPLQFKGVEIPKPDPAVKKRHWWFVGPPDLGKSYDLEQLFEGKRVYKVPIESNYPFEGYRGEEIIVYDDTLPKLKEILAVSGTYLTPTHVYGNTRYSRSYWPWKKTATGWCRTIIVLSNVLPEYNTESFDARFNIKELTE